MSDIKSSLDKIKNIPKDPMIYHTKGTFFEKIGQVLTTDLTIEFKNKKNNQQRYKSKHKGCNHILTPYDKRNGK